MDYLPDVRFSDHRRRSFHTNPGVFMDLIYARRRREGDNPVIAPNGLDPIQILRDAFEKYIVRTPIESNTIGIKITYLENVSDIEPRSIFIIKRLQSPTDRLLVRVNNTSDEEYVTNDQIEDPGNVFENDQLEQVITQLQGFNSILMITLCEVYNDTATRRARRTLGYTYNPFTIPIKVLYRNVPEEWINTIREHRRTQSEQGVLRATQAQLERERAEHQRRIEQFTNPTEEGQREILNNPFFEQNPFENETGYQSNNPDKLEVVNDPGILDKPLTSFVWPGMCQICLESDPSESGGLCRVDCAVGHIFHCDCMNGYRNTRTIYGWNNKCPVCRTEIYRYANFPSSRNAQLPAEFGKARGNSEIKYLKSLI